MNFCQRCHWNNDEFSVFCSRCGATMLPPLVPNSSIQGVIEFQEDDKGEFFSLLDTVKRGSERRLEGVELHLEMQSLHNLRVSVVLDKLLEILSAEGMLDIPKFHRGVLEEVRYKRFGLQQKALLEKRREPVISHCRGARATRFAALVEGAWPLLYTPRHEEAVAKLHQALEIDRNNPALLLTLAEILFINGDYDGAERLNQRLLEKSPGLMGVTLLAAMIHLKRGDSSGALERLQTARESKPRSFTVQFLQGIAHFLSHHFVEAGEAFREAGRAAPLPVIPRLGAMAYYLVRENETAESLLGEVAHEFDDTGFADFLQGLIHLRLHRPRKADASFRLASQLNPRWRKILSRFKKNEGDETDHTQINFFTDHLRRSMEEMMTLFISEIQDFNG